MKTRICIGIGKNYYALSLIRNGKLTAKKSNDVVPKYKGNQHAILLCALLDYLQDAMPKEEIVFYGGNNFLSFEWENEWKKDFTFSARTKDVDLWKKVIKIVEAKKIDLKIIGADNPLSIAGQLKSRR